MAARLKSLFNSVSIIRLWKVAVVSRCVCFIETSIEKFSFSGKSQFGEQLPRSVKGTAAETSPICGVNTQVLFVKRTHYVSYHNE